MLQDAKSSSTTARQNAGVAKDGKKLLADDPEYAVCKSVQTFPAVGEVKALALLAAFGSTSSYHASIRAAMHPRMHAFMLRHGWVATVLHMILPRLPSSFPVP